MCSKCRVCCCGRSVSVIVAAVYTLIQSGLYFAASVMAILVHKCRMPMDGNRYLYGMYITYLRNTDDCGPVELAKLGIPVNIESPVPAFEDGLTNAINRTVLFSWLYLGFSAAWILASLMLIIGGLRPCSGKFGHYFFWQPWIWATLANIVLDVVMAIYFATDLQQTSNMSDFLSWLGLKNIPEISVLLENIQSAALAIPTYVMMGIGLRAVLLELFNIYFLLMVTFVWFEVLGEFVAKTERYSSDYERSQAKVNKAFEPDRPNNLQSTPNEPLQSNRTSSSSTMSVQSSRPNTGPVNRLTRQISKNTNQDVEERLKKYQSITGDQLTSSTYPANNNNNNNNNNNGHVPKQILPRVAPPKEPIPDYNTSDPPQKHLFNIPAPDYDTDEPEELPPSQPVATVVRTTSSVQNLRHTLEQNTDKVIRERSSSPHPDDRVSRNSSFVNRPELRNQLPWSYFGKTEEPAPMRAFVHPITGERMVRSSLPPAVVQENREHEESDEATSRF